MYSIDPNVEIGSVHLVVSDLKRSIMFYEKFIGFQILKQEGNTAELSVDGQTTILILEENQNAIQKPRRTTGLYHFAILLPDRKDLAFSLKHLIENQVPLQGVGDHQYSEAIYLGDPDNNGIEIYVDRPQEQWEVAPNGEYVSGTYAMDVEDLFTQLDDSDWNGLPVGTKIGHVHLHVDYLEKAQQFYCDYLGMGVKTTLANHALFVAGGTYHHHVGLNVWNGVGASHPPENATGMKYFSLVLSNEEELDRLIEHLNESGVEVTSEDEIYLIRDYAGNQIKLTTK